MGQENAIVDKLLTKASNAIVPEGFIAEKILTPTQVMQTTGKIGKYGNAHLRVQSNTKVTGRKDYPVVETIVRDSDTYDVELHGLQDMVTLKEYKNVEKPFDAENDTAMGLTLALQIGKEKALADALTSTSILTSNKTLSGNAQYNNLDHDSSDPLGDAAEAHSTIRANIGLRANYVAMSGAVFDYLQFHSKILDKLGFKYNRAGTLSSEEIGRALGVKNVLIGDAVYNSAKEGQTDSIADIWGKDLIFFRKAEQAAKYQKTLGYDITLIGEPRRTVQKWNMNTPRGAKGLSVDDNYDQLLVDVGAAFLVKDAIA